jgi:hypothetical protein
MLRKLLCLFGLHDWRNATILHGKHYGNDGHVILVQSCRHCAFGRIYTQHAGTW